jgi:hypothetical protein
MHPRLASRIGLAALAVSLAGFGAWYAFSPPRGPAPNPDIKEPLLPTPDQLDARFAAQVHPFLQRYCYGCHDSDKHKGGLDLSQDTTVTAIAQNPRRCRRVLEKLQDEAMPPEEAPRQPQPDERAAVIAWLRDLREHQSQQNTDDPGPVLARRLTNAEFDHTIRDLTGVDIRPTHEFPVDPANEAGFDNSGESLAMSPPLLKKYLAAARLVADHVVLQPDGFVFAPHPVVTDTDRDKYCVQRIIDFYQRHQVDLADYFLAAWRFHHREALGKPNATLREIADEAGISAKYLAIIWPLVTASESAEGPLGELQTRWRQLPPDGGKDGEVQRECERLRDLVLRKRKDYPAKVDKLQAKGISNGSQPFILWRNDQLAAQHLLPSSIANAENAEDVAQFCRVFPDAFVVTERAPYYDAGSSPKGRLLSAGFHLMQGYYRDDRPLYELVLDEAAQHEIDALWEELHFITLDVTRQYKDFIFFERAEPPRFMFEAEFDFARSEDKDATSHEKIDRLAKAYLTKARANGAGDLALQAIESYFARMSAEIRRVERARLAAEPSHLQALLQFAERAYRRPLSAAERDDLLAFYHKLRDRDELAHEEALRDTIATILLSPNFGYRIDLAEPGTTARPLSDYALASRLSYFLWASMPDAELLARAAAGDLHNPSVLKAQARRMVRDPKVRGLATEFAANWLDFRRFEEHNAVDRERFPTFTNELRTAMFEEPIRYFMDLVQRNRSVLDLLHGDDTFVNRPLAKHYGMPEPANDTWVHIDDAQRYGRGGLLPMAVFQTKNAPGLRTSPVKRGYWVVRRVLGEEIPPPPPTVPELPKDEANLGDLTLPQLLARHRADKNCAACHRRFDSVGLVFESFGPIGELRTKDLGGRAVETTATFPDGKDRSGVSGLREYLRDKRQDDFLDNLCRKLFAYALCRTLLPSDQKAIDAIKARLAADNYAFESLVQAIVTSPQFLNKRAQGDSPGP